MFVQDDLQMRWWKLEEKLLLRFGKKPNVEAILFLIGIQEMNWFQKKISKEQKQDLMHVAVCTILSLGQYFEITHYDEDNWPIFIQKKTLPNMSLVEQENFLKDYILLYFEQHTF